MGKNYQKQYSQTFNVLAGRATVWPPLQLILEGHTAGLTLVAFSPDGTKLASGFGDNTIRLWDATTGEQFEALFEGHTERVCSAAPPPDGTKFASGSVDTTVRMCDNGGTD